MRTSTRLEHAAVELLKEAVQGYAALKVQEEESGGSTDRPGRILRIEPESGTPTAVHLQVRSSGTNPRTRANQKMVWVLDDAEANVRQTLKADGESFVDVTGAVHLRLPGLVVDRTDLEPASVQPPSGVRRNPFADRASRVVRTLLSNPPGEAWTVKQLAEAADVAYSTAWYATRALEERQLILVKRAGNATRIALEEPRALIRAWVSDYRWSENRTFRYHAPAGDPRRFLRRLLSQLPSGLRWGLTLHAGAQLIAPHATWDRIHMYVDLESEDEVLRLGSEVGDRAGEDGRLVLMLPYYDTSVWMGLREVDDLPVVSSIQLVLDLWHYPVRGREQAEHLIETVLEPEWRE